MQKKEAVKRGDARLRGSGPVRRARRRRVRTVLVAGLSPASAKALGRLLGRRATVERAEDVTDCFRKVRSIRTLVGIVVDPGPLEFDALTFAVLLRRHQPDLPLFFFGSARNISTISEVSDPGTTHCFKSPFEISRLAKAIIASTTKTSATSYDWRRENLLVARALEFVEVNYPSIAGVSHISTHLGVSREHLSREFTRYIGHTLWDFLTIYRLEKAKELLGGGFLVKQVFDEVGFGCESSFFRAFLKHTGTTPRAYREAALAQNPVVRAAGTTASLFPETGGSLEGL